jgi:hypothetical protein
MQTPQLSGLLAAGAVIPFQIIGQPEFFHKPDDSIRLRDAEVVNSNHGIFLFLEAVDFGRLPCRSQGLAEQGGQEPVFAD